VSHRPLLAIINPAAGGGRCRKLAPAALADLRASGLEIHEQETAGPGEATELVREAYREGVRGFIAVGGDGTGYEVVNGLLPEALGAQGQDKPLLGFLPLGTGNSFLRDFTTDGAVHAARALREGRRRPCDVVRLVHDGGELFFINLLGIGFLADVATTANQRFKGLGAGGYVAGVLLRTALLKQHPVEMHLDGGDMWKQFALFVSFCNSRYTGGQMMMAPHAATDDGKLDVVLAGPMGRLGLLSAFPRIFSGEHIHLPAVTYCQASRIELAFDGPLDVMVDGEVFHLRPRSLEVLAGAIEVCA